jgi:hypothetical protein
MITLYLVQSIVILIVIFLAGMVVGWVLTSKDDEDDFHVV